MDAPNASDLQHSLVASKDDSIGIYCLDDREDNGHSCI
jgi:hypothetical protein